MIPFSIENKSQISGASGGELSLRGDDLIFRFSDSDDAASSGKRLRLSLSQIKYLQYKSRLLGAEITVHTLKREFAAPFTDAEDVSFTLNIKKAHASEAESFVRFVKLRLAETIVRGESENPYFS